MDQEGVIGRAGGLPWHLPGDLRRFREITWGKPIVMGRRTYASIGRPLPGRENIVLTRDLGFHAPGVRIVYTLAEALAAANDAGARLDHVSATAETGAADKLLGARPQHPLPPTATNAFFECCIIGGASLYADLLPVAERIYLTEIHARVGGDTYFPAFPHAEWREISREDRPACARDPLPLSFVVLERPAR
jgi:dihydrofolate reductase